VKGYEKVKNKVGSFFRVMYVFMVSWVFFGLRVHANEDDPLSWTKDSSNEVFDKVTEGVQGVGGSAYRLLNAVGMVVLLLSIIVVGLSYAMVNNPQKSQAVKDRAKFILIAGIIIFGASGIFLLIRSMGTGLSSSLTG